MQLMGLGASSRGGSCNSEEQDEGDSSGEQLTFPEKPQPVLLLAAAGEVLPLGAVASSSRGTPTAPASAATVALGASSGGGGAARRGGSAGSSATHGPACLYAD